MSLYDLLALAGILGMIYGIQIIMRIGRPMDNDILERKWLYTLAIVGIIICVVSGIQDSKVFTQFNKSIFARSAGTYCYTVKLTDNKDRSYYLPAEVEITDNDITDADSNYTVRSYRVVSAYFDNGSSVFFGDNDMYFEKESIKNGDKEYATVDKKDWTVELLDKPNYTDRIHETSIKPTVWSIPYAVFIIWGIICFFMLIFYILEQSVMGKYYTWERKEVKKNATEEREHDTSIQI